MLLPNFTFLLLIIIDGCAGPLPAGQGCAAQNLSVRIPYEKLEQCDEARRRMVTPAGIEKFIRAMCIAVPKDQKQG
jgi:hypothetical protein